MNHLDLNRACAHGSARGVAAPMRESALAAGEGPLVELRRGMADLGFTVGRNPDGVDDTVTGTLLVVRGLLAAREVEKCLVCLPGGDRTREQLEAFAIEVEEAARDFAPHIGAAVGCDLDRMVVEVIFTPDENVLASATEFLAEALGQFFCELWSVGGTTHTTLDCLVRLKRRCAPMLRALGYPVKPVEAA